MVSFGGAEWGECGLWGLAGVQILAGGSRGRGLGSVWGGRGLSLAYLSVQDSDGDKSDDLVVDVSNEVRAGPGHRTAVPVRGGWRLLLSWVGAVVSRLLHRYQQPQLGDEGFGVGASSWSGGGGQGLAA